MIKKALIVLLLALIVVLAAAGGSLAAKQISANKNAAQQTTAQPTEQTEERSAANTPDASTEPVETTTEHAAHAALPEAELKALAAEYGTVLVWQYADYDKDGTEEAFAAVGKEDDEWLSAVENIVFVSSDGQCKIYDQSDRLVNGLLENSDLGYSYKEAGRQGIFAVDLSGGGSGYITVLYSVKDGKPYELDLSGEIQGFFATESGVFYTTENEFSAKSGHSYPEVRLIFDAETGQFKKGERLSGVRKERSDSYKISEERAKRLAIQYYTETYGEEDGKLLAECETKTRNGMEYYGVSIKTKTYADYDERGRGVGDSWWVLQAYVFVSCDGKEIFE